MTKNELLAKANQLQQQYVDALNTYWYKFNYFDSWQFWLVVTMLIVPLIVLYLKIDRTRLFELGFFGFCVHLVTTYVDMAGARLGYWSYPYFAIPLFPTALGLDASLIPVVFILLYQWVTDKKRNYYLYALLVGAAFAFIIKPIMNYLDLFRLHKGLNFIGLYLLAYVPIIFFSKWIFNAFAFLGKKQVLETRKESAGSRRYFLSKRKAK